MPRGTTGTSALCSDLLCDRVGCNQICNCNVWLTVPHQSGFWPIVSLPTEAGAGGVNYALSGVCKTCVLGFGST